MKNLRKFVPAAGLWALILSLPLAPAVVHGDEPAVVEDSEDFSVPDEVREQALPATPDGPLPEEMQDSYLLNPRDRVRVEVYGQEDLSTSQRLDGNGRIRMSLIGTVNVAGETIRDAERRIEERYREERILRNPEVTITVEEYSPRFVSVLGNVESPGRVEFPIEENRLDIVDLISKAGGFNRVARADRVRLIRIDDEGREETVTVNVQDMMQGRDRGDRTRVYVYPGDSVYVPERLF